MYQPTSYIDYHWSLPNRETELYCCAEFVVERLADYLTAEPP